MNREEIKALIELSSNVEEANNVIEDYVKIFSIEEKIAYLKGMFDVEIFHKTGANLTADK